MEMPSIEPAEDQVSDLRNMKHEGPIVMLNLLKFKPDGGKELYDKYAVASTRLILKLGGKILYYGKPVMPVIGDEMWDAVILVLYPSIPAFLGMIESEPYRTAAVDRHNSLLDSRLIAMDTVPLDPRITK
jgi:uncharacterized protein (DUF1330 family)